MNFKVLIIITVLFVANLESGNLLPGGTHSLKLHVLDPDERYPVNMELSVRDDSKIASVRIDYPTYHCTSVLKSQQNSEAQVVIAEKMIEGKERCEEGKYVLHIARDASFENTIKSIDSIDDGKTIHTVIRAQSYMPSKLFRFFIQYNIKDINEVFRLSEEGTLEEYLALEQRKQYRALACKRLFELLKNNTSKLVAFAQKYPESKEALLAEKKIYARIRDSQNAHDFLDFLQHFPSPRVVSIEGIKTILHRLSTISGNNRKAYDVFLKTYYPTLYQKELTKRQIVRKKQLKEKEEIYRKRLADAGLSVITNIKKVVKGKRYIPIVTNPYYTTVNKNVTVNGKLNLISHTKKEYVSNGGYNVDITGYDFIFAIENSMNYPYIVTFEVDWNNTEYHYEKESYCMEKGWVFCAQTGQRYGKKERHRMEHIKRSYIIGAKERVKDKVYIGEKKPNLKKIHYRIGNFSPIDKEVFEKILFLNTREGMENVSLSKQYFLQLRQNSALKDVFPMLEKRMRKIESYHIKRFDHKYRSMVKIALQFEKNFDPDFNNNVKIMLTSPKPMFVDLTTPNGVQKRLAISKKKESGMYFLDIMLKDISGITKHKLSKQIKVQHVYPMDEDKAKVVFIDRRKHRTQ